MPQTFWIDTNVILRFLIQDQAKQSAAASELMKAADRGEMELFVHPLMIAECCYVLEGTSYKFPQQKISQWLINFITSEGIKTKATNLMVTALEIYGNHKVDFEDAYLAALSAHDTPTQLITFDYNDFKKLNIEFYQPQEITPTL